MIWPWSLEALNWIEITQRSGAERNRALVPAYFSLLISQNAYICRRSVRQVLVGGYRSLRRSDLTSRVVGLVHARPDLGAVVFVLPSALVIVIKPPASVPARPVH